MSSIRKKLKFGYCTNVHAGKDLETALQNLLQYATAVRQTVVGQGTLPVGLWFSEKAANELVANRVDLGAWLSAHGLEAYTFNGFPQGDFHQQVVKHAVYEPTWTCQSRAAYTKLLAGLLESLLPNGQTGSISTLPLGWPHAPWHAENYSMAADNLIDVAGYLHRLSQHRGCEIVLAIEPEPGCVLDTAEDLVEFFEHYLLRGANAELARRYITVCHDICHSSVMFEPQHVALKSYLDAGIRIGKVQVSSAIHVPWDRAAGDIVAQRSMLEQVSAFSEPRYLHQTTACDSSGKLSTMDTDLAVALQRCSQANYPVLPWRIHFHVPIFADSLGSLTTTQSDIETACRFLEAHRHTSVADRDWFTGHYEVETYAWNVLPKQLAAVDLASGISDELNWFQRKLDDCLLRE